MNIHMFLILHLSFGKCIGDNGYRLWLKYDLVKDLALLNNYRAQVRSITVAGNLGVKQSIKEELANGLEGLPGRKTPAAGSLTSDGMWVACTVQTTGTTRIVP